MHLSLGPGTPSEVLESMNDERAGTSIHGSYPKLYPEIPICDWAEFQADTMVILTTGFRWADFRG